MSQTSVKKTQTCGKNDKKLQTSEKKTQTCEKNHKK